MATSCKDPGDSYHHWKSLLNLEVDWETDAACRYLESLGLRFLIDFGTDNAVDMAFYYLEYL